MLTLAFWRATLERVVSSIAGGALAALGSDALGVFDVDFAKVASVALLAGLVSLLKALLVGKVTDGGPSLGNAETLNPAAPDKSVAVPVEDAELPAGDYIPGTVDHLVNDALSQPYTGDSKTEATYHGGDTTTTDPAPKPPTGPQPGGYWGGI